jgi:hypothetical protein
MSKAAILLDYDEILHKTPGATLFSMYELELWVPNSIIIELNEEEKEVTLPYWFAYKEELI